MRHSNYIAFLRGINVGGHHKVPMAELRKEMEKNGFREVTTLLNTGNIIFEAANSNPVELELLVKEKLENKFGFPIPVLLRNAEDIKEIIIKDPFKDVEITKDTRLYVSFLRNKTEQNINLPWLSPDRSFRILEVSNRSIFSVLDLSKGQSVKGMEALEKLFGKEITTRNWNTLEKIAAKM